MKKFYEKDLEEIIFNADSDELFEKGLRCFNGKRFRQLSLGKYGILDLLVVNRRKTDFYNEPYLDFAIYELKEDKVGVGAFFQAIRYARAIQCYMQKRKPNMNFSIDIYLIGSEVDTSGSLCFLPDLINRQDCSSQFGLLNAVFLYTYDYGFKGITFEEHDGYYI